MNNTIRNTLVGLATVALSIAPAVSFAHETGGDIKANIKSHAEVNHSIRGWGKYARNAVEGTVNTVVNGVLTVSKSNGTNVTVQTNTDTAVKKDGQSVTIADITAGVKIVAKGTWDSTHSVLMATKITIVNKLHPVRQWMADLFAAHVVVGNVTVINGNTITVKSENGSVYTVNAASANVYSKSQTQVTLSDVKIGDKVQVMGDISGTSVSAQIIHDFSISD